MTCDPSTTISSTDLSDLKKDITTIDTVVESSLDTTTTKDGKTINTLLGQLKLLGYQPPITYTSGIDFDADDNTKTVEEAGVVYAPLPSALPFTTSGTFVGDDDARFFVVQRIAEVSIVFDTLSDMVNSAFLFEDNELIMLKGRLSVDDRRGGLWFKVQTSAVTPNGDGIVQSVGQPTQSFVLSESILNSQGQISDTPTPFSGWTVLEPTHISQMKSLADISVDSDGATVNQKPIKAWNNPRGIADSAVAGSFVLHDGTTEPGTQVSNFGALDNVGIQQSRDAVAVFAQVNSADPTVVTSNTTYTSTSATSPDFIPIFDNIDAGMIIDVNFGTAGWVGAAITSKTAPDTVNFSSWREIDGVSGPAATPANGLPATINRHSSVWGANFNAIVGSATAGANQAIGIETGLSCAKIGTGANSKAYFAVNLGGERPEFAYTLTGGWGKGYTSTDCNIYGFQSDTDKLGFKAIDATDKSFVSEDPGISHIDCMNNVTDTQFIVKENSKVFSGKNVESGVAQLNLRGDGDFTTAYDETEFQIYDPSTVLVDRQGFFISQEYGASSSAASFKMGVGNTGNHTYQFTMNTQGTDRMTFHSSGNIHAGVDGTQQLGVSFLRWSEVFAVNGTINTSDERLKTFMGDFTEAEKAVALKLKKSLTSFKWNDSIEREESGGKKARIHIGIGAQTLAKSFEDEGLDPSDYAMFCYDEWTAEESGDKDGNRYGVRLDQVMAFILANT